MGCRVPPKQGRSRLSRSSEPAQRGAAKGAMRWDTPLEVVSVEPNDPAVNACLEVGKQRVEV